MDFTVLATFDNSISANLLRTKLENEGISCFLTNEHFTDLMPHYFNVLGCGVQLLVATDQLDQARKVIGPRDSSSCPHCGSSNIKLTYERSASKYVFGFTAFFFAFPIGNLLNTMECKDCLHQFKIF